MSKTYPETVINEAKILVETTEMSYPEIADKLGVDRSMTIYDWKKKYGWNRTESELEEEEMEEIWKEIGENALNHLRTGEFKTMTEAVKVYDQAMKHIKNVAKKKDAEDSKSGVLEGLEAVEDEKVVENQEITESEGLRIVGSEEV